MSAELSAQSEQFLQEMLTRGVFVSRGQALDAAIALLKQQEDYIHGVNKGIAELERGEGRPIDIDEVWVRIEKRLAGQN